MHTAGLLAYGGRQRATGESPVATSISQKEIQKEKREKKREKEF